MIDTPDKDKRAAAAREERLQKHIASQRAIYAAAGVPFDRKEELLIDMAFSAGVEYAAWWLSTGHKEGIDGNLN